MKKWQAIVATGVMILGLNAHASTQEYDPARRDLPDIDATNPPGMVELSFTSHGARLNGHMYLANGAGPHPAVILLHGFPGNEKNLDLAQSMRRAGFNVLFFHYRGAWGSEGDFTFSNVIADVASAIAELRSERGLTLYRTDPGHIALVGHSMGGFAALMGAAADPRILCVAGIAPANLGNVNPVLNNAEALKGFAAYSDTLGSIRNKGTSAGNAIVADMEANRTAFDTLKLGPKMVGKSVLLIAGAKDTVLPPALFHAPVVAAYQAQEGINFSHITLDGDHSFSWTRFALMDTVVSWLDTNCR